MFARRSPWGSFFEEPRYVRPSRYEMDARRRQQQEYALRQEQLRQQELVRQKRDKARLQKRQELLRKYDSAARVIQDAWRERLAKKQEEKESKAAAVITRHVRRVAAYKTGRKMMASLSKLRQVRLSLATLTEEYQASPFGYRHNLWLVDQVEKKMFSLDAIPTWSSPFIRAARKTIVQEAQETLRFADVVSKTLNRKAKVLQSWWTKRHDSNKAERMESAARVITKTIRAAPRVKSAKREAQLMKSVREQKRQLEQMRHDYARKLRKIMQNMKEIECSSPSLEDARDGTMKLAKRDLNALLRAQNRALRGVSSV